MPYLEPLFTPLYTVYGKFINPTAVKNEALGPIQMNLSFFIFLSS